jgi:hypothetical protein
MKWVLVMLDRVPEAQTTNLRPSDGGCFVSALTSCCNYLHNIIPTLGFLLVLLSLLSSSTGCSTQKFITARSIPFNPLTTQLSLTSSKGPQASGRTLGLLRKYDLLPTYNADIRKCFEEVQKLSLTSSVPNPNATAMRTTRSICLASR